MVLFEDGDKVLLCCVSQEVTEVDVVFVFSNGNAVKTA